MSYHRMTHSSSGYQNHRPGSPPSGEDYKIIRGLVSQQPFREGRADRPGSPLSPSSFSPDFPKPSQRNQRPDFESNFFPPENFGNSVKNNFERLYHDEKMKNQTIEEELRHLKGFAAKFSSDQAQIKSGYEDFIARLTRENEALRDTEEQLLQITRTKRALELELERASEELKRAKSNSENSEVVSELQLIIQRLKDEKNHLRSQLENHKSQLSDLVTNITMIRETNSGEVNSLKEQLGVLQNKYIDLEREYQREKNKPILMPDDSELRKLLQEKVNTIDSLQNRIKFLDTELVKAQNKPCPQCPQKDGKITALHNHIRELENRPPNVQRIEVIESRPQRVVLPPQQVNFEVPVPVARAPPIVHQIVECPPVVTRAAPIRTVHPSAYPPVLSQANLAHCCCAHSCSCPCARNRCSLCGCDGLCHGRRSEPLIREAVSCGCGLNSPQKVVRTETSPQQWTVPKIVPRIVSPSPRTEAKFLNRGSSTTIKPYGEARTVRIQAPADFPLEEVILSKQKVLNPGTSYLTEASRGPLGADGLLRPY